MVNLPEDFSFEGFTIEAEVQPQSVNEITSLTVNAAAMEEYQVSDL